MGKFVELMKAASVPKAEHLHASWAEQYPLLMEALYPAPGKASGTFASPKFSITLFSEGCAFKAVLGSKTHNQKFWITLDGPECALEALESALVNHPEYWRDAKEEN